MKKRLRKKVKKAWQHSICYIGVPKRYKQHVNKKKWGFMRGGYTISVMTVNRKPLAIVKNCSLHAKKTSIGGHTLMSVLSEKCKPMAFKLI